MVTQSRIIQLDPLLANQIAAGEVVERPASVVKELVENSLDAGATKVEIEVEGGGSRLLRIRDNGAGILKEDLALAFSRHATSKIRTTQDLAAIRSLGFRGEALASIACVSQCRLISRPAEQDEAWQIQIAPDLTPILTLTAHPVGTMIEVADLFYNTPVRRKFLRSEKTEFQSIDEVVRRLALSYPAVSFRLKHQQRLVRHYPAVSAISGEKSRLTKICGSQFVEQSFPIAMQAVGLSLQGWIGHPSMGRRQADCQYFFVNQRMVKDRLLNHAIKTIYHQQPQMGEGTYPCYVLYLTLDPLEVDVNVHPTKQEVRFAQARLVHDFLAKCIEETLQKGQPPKAPIVSMPSRTQTPFLAVAKPQSEKPCLTAPTAEQEESMPSFARRRYVMMEQEEGVVIVNLLAAKKQLLGLYFKLNGGKVPMRPLLFPQRFPLGSAEPKVLTHMLSPFGFQFRLEDRQITVLQQPAIFTQEIPALEMKKLILLTEKQDSQKLHAALTALTVEISLSEQVLQSLLPELILQEGPWRHLRHEDFLLVDIPE